MNSRGHLPMPTSRARQSPEVELTGDAPRPSSSCAGQLVLRRLLRGETMRSLLASALVLGIVLAVGGDCWGQPYRPPVIPRVGPGPFVPHGFPSAGGWIGIGIGALIAIVVAILRGNRENSAGQP